MDQIRINWSVETWGWGLVPHLCPILCLVIFDYWKTWLKLVMLENLQACFFNFPIFYHIINIYFIVHTWQGKLTVFDQHWHFHHLLWFHVANLLSNWLQNSPNGTFSGFPKVDCQDNDQKDPNSSSKCQKTELDLVE